MIMHWPQIAMVVLMALETGCALALHGKPRKPFSLWTSLLGSGIFLWILIEGGFFG